MNKESIRRGELGLPVLPPVYGELMIPGKLLFFTIIFLFKTDWIMTLAI